jgi:hypothetical protein
VAIFLPVGCCIRFSMVTLYSSCRRHRAQPPMRSARRTVSIWVFCWPASKSTFRLFLLKGHPVGRPSGGRVISLIVARRSTPWPGATAPLSTRSCRPIAWYRRAFLPAVTCSYRPSRRCPLPRQRQQARRHPVLPPRLRQSLRPRHCQRRQSRHRQHRPSA